MNTNLKGKTIVLTGITGGIGKATAELLLSAGAKLIVSARSTEKLNSALAELHGDIHGYVMELTDPNSVETFFNKVGKFDHLVTPAASSMLGGISELNIQAARELVESKQWGQLLCVHYGAKQLSKNGSITLFSGTVTQKPMPGGSIFAAVGSATEAAARVWALELAPIRINTVVPGIVATNIWNELAGSKEAANSQLAQIADSLPVKRVGKPEDIARAVSFLIDSTFINGISLVVDGGHRLV